MKVLVFKVCMEVFGKISKKFLKEKGRYSQLTQIFLPFDLFDEIEKEAQRTSLLKVLSMSRSTDSAMSM